MSILSNGLIRYTGARLGLRRLRPHRKAISLGELVFVAEQRVRRAPGIPLA